MKCKFFLYIFVNACCRSYCEQSFSPLMKSHVHLRLLLNPTHYQNPVNGPCPTFFLLTFWCTLRYGRKYLSSLPFHCVFNVFWCSVRCRCAFCWVLWYNSNRMPAKCDCLNGELSDSWVLPSPWLPRLVASLFCWSGKTLVGNNVACCLHHYSPLEGVTVAVCEAITCRFEQVVKPKY